MIFDLGLNVNSTHISINKKYFKLENALIGWSNPFSSALQVKKISVCVFFEKGDKCFLDVVEIFGCHGYI